MRLSSFLDRRDKRLLAVLLAALSFFPPLGISEELPALPKGPLVLTSVTSEQLSANYWINRIPNANRLLKTPEQLAQLNEEIVMTVPDQVDLFKWSPPRGSNIRNQLQLEYDTISNRKLFDGQGKPVSKSIFPEKIKPVMEWEQVPNSLKVTWGVTTKATSVRALPTSMKMIEGADDFEFDQLQFTLIKLWTPVAVYYESTDKNWYYIQAPYVRGWVKAEDIAIFPSRDAVKKYIKRQSILVVTGESISVCQEPGCAGVFQRPSMGTILPLIDKTDEAYVVAMPFRSAGGEESVRKGYVSRKSDVSEGFPAFTQANIIRQAFKLLGARYGWGGMYNGRDCSGFTHDVFLSMGVAMPRDSKQQWMVGTQLGHFKPYEAAEKKTDILRHHATPGITILRMSLHIMLYLGEVDGKFYIIHSTWAERIGDDPVEDKKRRINQVVVSDLSLNGNSYLGALFDRIIAINEVN